MKPISRHAVACVAVLCCIMLLLVRDCEAQKVSAGPADNDHMRERIGRIFRETLQQGKGAVKLNGGGQVTSWTLIPPPAWCVDEIRSYGDGAIPILTEYLSSDNGFEKYLAMRFLGLIGTGGIVGPLRKVALDDPSSSFRLAAVLWLGVAPWDLAAPTIRHIADKDSSPEVREQAKEILRQHVANK